jgi:formate dehydrogenase subunit beta
VKGTRIQPESEGREVLLRLLEEGLNKDLLGAALLPVEVPGEDSFAHLLVRDTNILEKANPMPPVMSVQGGKAMRSLTLYGGSDKLVAAVLRPCEVRASVELSSLNQVDLTNVLLISYDCPGTVPLSDYVKDPAKGKEIHEKVRADWTSDDVRPVCKVCTSVGLGSEDLHVASLGGAESDGIVIAVTDKGREFLEGLGYSDEAPLKDWEAEIETLRKKRSEARERARAEWSSTFAGPDGVLGTLSNCINCHNCQRVCPICYCRQCYFDSDALDLPPENYLDRASRKGSLRFPSDTLLFHLTRMSHMGLSCVSCGACEDACPMDIPIAQIFSLVGADAQELFDHTPGIERGRQSPLVTYRDEEFREVEMPYVETLEAKGGENG